jgi:hypothetical protein
MNTQGWPLFQYAGRLERPPVAKIQTEQRVHEGIVELGVRVVTTEAAEGHSFEAESVHHRSC